MRQTRMMSMADDLRVPGEQLHEAGLVSRLGAEQFQLATLVLEKVPHSNVAGEHGFQGEAVPGGILQPNIALAVIDSLQEVVYLLDVCKFHENSSFLG